jgi:hypothetical protein
MAYPTKTGVFANGWLSVVNLVSDDLTVVQQILE